MNNERGPRREVALGRRVCPPREPAEDPGGWRRGARGVPSASLPLPAPSRPPPWRGLLLSSRSPPWRPHGAGRRAGAQETPVESNAPRADQRLLGARRAGCHGAAFLGGGADGCPWGCRWPCLAACRPTVRRRHRCRRAHTREREGTPREAAANPPHPRFSRGWQRAGRARPRTAGSPGPRCCPCAHRGPGSASGTETQAPPRRQTPWDPAQGTRCRDRGRKRKRTKP